MVPMHLNDVVWALAILPEMFWSANDCACKPATEVLRASKIPMFVSKIRSGRRRSAKSLAAIEGDCRKRYAKENSFVKSTLLAKQSRPTGREIIAALARFAGLCGSAQLAEGVSG